MRFLYDIILAYDLIRDSISSHSPHTDVDIPVMAMSLYKTLMTFVMVCSSMQPYVVCWVNILQS